MNKKLRRVNEHQKCLLTGCRAELEACRQELVRARASLVDNLGERGGEREQDTSRRTTEQDLKMVSFSSIRVNADTCTLIYTCTHIICTLTCTCYTTHMHTHHMHTNTHTHHTQHTELTKQLQVQLSGVREEHRAVLGRLKEAHTLLDKHIHTSNTAQESEVTKKSIYMYMYNHIFCTCTCTCT